MTRTLHTFLSNFTNKIDKKGRVSAPASFRQILSDSSFKGFVAFRSLTHPCIEAFAMEHMEAFSTRIDTFQLFSEEQTDLTASIFADAETLAFDGDGRITLTDTLVTHANLKDKVAFVGRGPTFQIWEPAAFQHYQQEARLRLKTRKPVLTLASQRKEEVS